MNATSGAANGDVVHAAGRQPHVFGERAALREIEQGRSLVFSGQYELETTVARITSGRELEPRADERNVDDLDQQILARDRLAVDFDLVMMRLGPFDDRAEQVTIPLQSMFAFVRGREGLRVGHH